MKNIIYFLYFIKTTDYRQLTNDLKRVRQEINKPVFKILWHMIRVSLKYKASFKDYTRLKFYRMKDMDINSYVTTGRLYEFHTSMNKRKHIDFFRNKKKFNDTFKKYIGREYRFLDKKEDVNIAHWLLKKDCIIAKPTLGVSGLGIERIIVKEWPDISLLLEYLRSKKLELLEECIQQHGKMKQINPTSVNSIRIVTVQYDQQVDIISAVLRIGVNKHVDNFSAGGIAAPVDVKTGIVFRPAVTQMGNDVFERHPVTNTQILGFKIPFWEDIIRMIDEAAWVVPEIRTVGWDIAVTEIGPVIIEGNDNWNKYAFQIPYGKGMQHILNRYL